MARTVTYKMTLGETFKMSERDTLTADQARHAMPKMNTWGCSSVGRFDSLVWRGIFLPESTVNADSLTVSVHPFVQSHALTSVCMLKIL